MIKVSDWTPSRYHIAPKSAKKKEGFMKEEKNNAVELIRLMRAAKTHGSLQNAMQSDGWRTLLTVKNRAGCYVFLIQLQEGKKKGPTVH